MTTFHRRTLVQSLSLAALLPSAGFAQSAWPAKPVTMVVPFPAGGGTDAFARPLSAQFASFLSADIKRWAAVVKASGAKLD